MADTEVARSWPGHDVLDDPNWTPASNDRWIGEIVDNGQRVHTATPYGPAHSENVWDYDNDRPKVYGTELRQLQDAGYMPNGDYLDPPGASCPIG